MGSSCFPSSVIKWQSFTKLRLFYLFFVFSLSLNCVASFESDKSVLLQFKNSVSDPSGLLSGWDLINTNHCHWNGVSCDANSRVVSLNITGNGNYRASGRTNSFHEVMGKLPSEKPSQQEPPKPAETTPGTNPKAAGNCWFSCFSCFSFGC